VTSHLIYEQVSTLGLHLSGSLFPSKPVRPHNSTYYTADPPSHTSHAAGL